MSLICQHCFPEFQRTTYVHGSNMLFFIIFLFSKAKLEVHLSCSCDDEFPSFLPLFTLFPSFFFFFFNFSFLMYFIRLNLAGFILSYLILNHLSTITIRSYHSLFMSLFLPFHGQRRMNVRSFGDI